MKKIIVLVGLFFSLLIGNDIGKPFLQTSHSEYITSLAVTANGKFVISANADNTIKLWDIKSEKSLRTLGDFSHGIYAIAITPDSNFFLSAGSDKQITLWNMKSGNKIKTF